MKTQSQLTIRSVAAALTLSLTAGFATPLVAVTTTLDLYRLGENDPGAATGNTGNATTTDAVGPNNLSRTGSPSYTNDTLAYQSSLAMKFGNSSPERYDIGTTVSSLQDNFGIEALVRVDGGFGGASAIAYNGNSANSGWGIYRIGNEYTGLFGGLVIIGGSGQIPAVPGAWTHVALVRDSGVTTLYAEGFPVATTGATPNVPAGAFNVGGRPDGGENFNGAIDNLRVFTFTPGTFNAATDLNVGHKNLAVYRLGENDPGATNGGSGNSTTIDLFGGHHLTKTGAQTYSNATAGGGTTLAMDFTGASGEYYSTGVFSTIMDNFRLEAWAASDVDTGNAVVAYNGDTGNLGGSGYGIFRLGNSWAVLFGGNFLQGFAPVQVGVLTHLVLERENGVNRFFVNGVQAGSSWLTVPNAAPNVNGHFMIGGNPLNAAESFDGRIDEVRLVQIPEPATGLLAVCGLALIGRRMRRMSLSN